VISLTWHMAAVACLRHLGPPPLFRRRASSDLGDVVSVLSSWIVRAHRTSRRTNARIADRAAPAGP